MWKIFLLSFFNVLILAILSLTLWVFISLWSGANAEIEMFILFIICDPAFLLSGIFLSFLRQHYRFSLSNCHLPFLAGTILTAFAFSYWVLKQKIFIVLGVIANVVLSSFTIWLLVSSWQNNKANKKLQFSKSDRVLKELREKAQVFN